MNGVKLLLVAICLCVNQAIASELTITNKVTGSVKNDNETFSLYGYSFQACACVPDFYLGWQRGICEFNLATLYTSVIPAGSIQSIGFQYQTGGTSSRTKNNVTTYNLFDIYKLSSSLADGVIEGTYNEFYGYTSSPIVNNHTISSSTYFYVDVTNYILPDITAGNNWTGLFLKEDASRETFAVNWLVTLDNFSLTVTYDEHWAWVYRAGLGFVQDWSDEEIDQLTSLWATTGDSVEIDGETWYYTNDDALFTGHTLGESWTDESGQKFIYLGSGLTSFGVPVAVPEPASLVLLGLGLLCRKIAAFFRR